MCSAFSQKIQPDFMNEIRILIEESENKVLQELANFNKINKKRHREPEQSYAVMDVSENVDDVPRQVVQMKE